MSKVDARNRGLTTLQRLVLRILEAANKDGLRAMTAEEIARVTTDLGTPLSKSQISGHMASLARRDRCWVANLRKYTGEFIPVQGNMIARYVSYWTITFPGIDKLNGVRA